MQFKEKTLGWNEIPLLLEVVSASSSKGLISDLYVNICKAAVEGVEDLPIRRRWKEDVGI